MYVVHGRGEGANNVDPKSHDGRILAVVLVVPPPPPPHRQVDAPEDHFHLGEHQVAVVPVGVVPIYSLAYIKLMHGYHQRMVDGVVVEVV